jgi:TRAP-type C4-dicarboxylate transport system permease small subunit
MISPRIASGLYMAVIRHALAAIMAVLLAIMILQVFFRYGLNSSLIWAEEICRYLLIWASFLACGIAYARGEIAAIELIDRALPRRAALLLGVFRNVLVLGLLVVLVYYGWRYAELSGRQPVPALGFLLTDLFGYTRPAPVTIFWVYVSVPVGMTLLGAHVAVQAVGYAWALVSPSNDTSQGTGDWQGEP